MGKAQEVADGFKHASTTMARIFGQSARSRILTDLSGQFNTVVQEIEVESLGEWERMRAAAFADPEFQQGLAAMTDLVESGRAEFYTIEATFGS